nr:hypothetical protein TetV2_00356 [Oceanusvirus sp.]
MGNDDKHDGDGSMAEDERVTEKSFVDAAERSSVSEKIAEKIASMISVHPCFSENRSANRSSHHGGGRKAHNGKRQYRGGRRDYHGGGSGGHSSMRPSRSMPLMLANGTDKERSIRSDLNKITITNYDCIFNRIRFVDDVDNLIFTFKVALEKSYLEPHHNVLYVRLFRDIFRSLACETREAAFGIFKTHVPTRESLIAEALRPTSDPATDYIGFCETAKAKRRIVGRCQTFSGLLDVGAISEHIGFSPLDLYMEHESAMRDILEGRFETAGDPDVVSGTEVMLESLGVMIDRHNFLQHNFKNALNVMGGTSCFPSNRCRFKVMDILGAG